MMQNLRAFEITILQVTNTKGLRVKIKDLRHKKTKIIPYSYEFNSCKDDAETYLKSLNIPCIYSCETEKGYIILSDNFDIMIK
jgi:hypothetical protein